MIKTFKDLVVYQKKVSLDRYSLPLAGGGLDGLLDSRDGNGCLPTRPPSMLKCR